MRLYLLQARKTYVPLRAGGKDSESECVAWYQFVWRGSRFGRPIPKVALCEPLSGILSNQTTSTARSIYSFNGRVRYQLSSRQHRDPRMEIESQTVPLPSIHDDTRRGVRIILVFNIEDKEFRTDNDESRTNRSSPLI